MLARNGFSVIQGVGPSREEILLALDTFCEASRDADMAILYSTGHGRECDGQVYLIPGDFPLKKGFGSEALARNAVPVEKITEACIASTMNLVFFAGCRASGKS